MQALFVRLKPAFRAGPFCQAPVSLITQSATFWITPYSSFCRSVYLLKPAAVIFYFTHHLQGLDRGRTYYRWIYVIESSFFPASFITHGP